MPATSSLQEVIDATFIELISKFKDEKAKSAYETAYAAASIPLPSVTLTVSSTAVYVDDTGAFKSLDEYVAPTVLPKTQPPLTYDEACDLLDKAVDEYGPDHVDAGHESGRHVYFVGIEPECLIGVVLAYRGVGPEIGQGTVGRIARRLPFAIDEKALRLLHAAQFRNDSGIPWGVAVPAAKAVTELERT